LLAAKYKVPVCPHAGGVGLCEYVQHLSMFDFISVTGTMKDRMIEYVDHLHEHFLDPVVINKGAYMPPEKPGYSIQINKNSLSDYAFPQGKVWKDILNNTHAT
jgi:L-fuconate dehydratase